jgi:hypothetical protein
MGRILPHSARRKNLSYPKGMKDGPKVLLYFHPATQPASQLSTHLFILNISATTFAAEL